MRRSVHILTAVLIVLTFIRPFECLFAGTQPQSTKCCLKGKCIPRATAADCCRTAPAGGSPFVGPQAASYTVDLVQTGSATVLNCALRTCPVLVVDLHSGSPPGDIHNLPLLI